MWPRWAQKLDYDSIRRAAIAHQLEPELVAAVVQIESAGNTYACRYEPHFKYTQRIEELAKACYASVETMKFMQKTSWGLMQVMGSVAYDHGLETETTLSRRWPTALTNPAMGLKYGCMHLKLKFDKYGPKPSLVYASYNAGSPRYKSDGTLINQYAVDRFMRFYRDLKR